MEESNPVGFIVGDQMWRIEHTVTTMPCYDQSLASARLEPEPPAGRAGALYAVTPPALLGRTQEHRGTRQSVVNCRTKATWEHAGSNVADRSFYSSR